MIGTSTALLLAGLAGAGSSVASGALAGRGKTTTQSSTPTLDPSMQPLQGAATQQLMQRMLNPGAGMQPLKTAAVDGVNKTYSAIPQRITEMLASRGFNNSGLLAKTIGETERGRAGDIAGVESKFAGMQLDREAQTMALINQILGLGRGVSSSTTMPGNSLGGAFGGLNDGLGDMASLMVMQRMLGKIA